MQEHAARKRTFFGPRIALLLAALLAATGVWAQRDDARAVTTIDAERIDGVADLEVTARGNVELKRDGTTVFSDFLRYNQEFGRIEADGGVRFELEGDRFFGPRLRYDTLEETGVFDQPTYVIQREQTARGKAERVDFLSRDVYRLSGATYTTCAPGQDDWLVETGELELDYRIDEARVRDGRLRFFDTTVLALPFAKLPLDKQRKSGFLTPYYAQTSTRGFEVGVPYYWNIAPERDATIMPVYMAKRGLQLKGDYRYLGRSYAGDLHLEYLDDRRFGDSRSGVSFQHTHQITPQLYGRVDYNEVSDDQYFADLSSQVRLTSLGVLPREGYLQYVGGLGAFTYGATARVQKFLTLQDPSAPIVPPHDRLPQLTFSGGINDVGGLVDLGLPAEYVSFAHPTLAEGGRLVTNPTLSVPVLAPGWFLRPKLGLRYSTYDLSRLTPGAAPGTSQRPSATIPWGSIDTGLVFERPVSWEGRPITQTLEPRAYYVYIPFRDQSDMPLFDTAPADFNYAQIFTENRFVGGDRFGDANEVTLALSSRLLGPAGRELLRATIAQKYYFDDERVGLTPTSPLRTDNSSDILASIGGRLSPAWAFDTTVQYKPGLSVLDKYYLSARYSPAIGKVLSASYRYQRDVLRQLDVSGQWPFARGWYAVGRYNYSFLDGRLLEGLAGFEYNAGCWVFRAVLQSLQTTTDTKSTGVYFQLQLNGLGEIGTKDIDALLTRSVPGYSVTNPRDPALAPADLRPRLPFQMTY
ncbi:MAG: LPS-assembly protein LptD [Burkholderiales bacterium]|nr:LPS-assembly protein LptD [Burkholderiales bacterium]